MDNLTSPDIDIASSDQYLLKPGDILFARTGASVGKTYLYNERDGKVYFAGFLIRAKILSENNPQFIFQNTLTKKYLNFIRIMSQRSGQPGVNAKEYTKYKIVIPKGNEQKKVGELLELIDNTINLHQRKIQILEKIKSQYLYKILPKKGKNDPELRFISFHQAWEQHKLGELGKTQSGIGFPNLEQKGIEGIPFYKVSDMNNFGNENEMTNANNYVTVEQIKRNKWLPIETVPAVIFAKVGAAIMLNRKRLVREPFLIDNNTMAYIFDENWDADFGKTLFETINLPRFAQVGALPSYNGSDIESIEITITNRVEQNKIGAFFKHINNTINCHQKKLDSLLKIKQVYLKKMFI